MEDGTVTITGDSVPDPSDINYTPTYEFDNNNSDLNGGTIHVAKGTLNVINTEIQNSKTRFKGGAINVGTGTVVIDDSTIHYSHTFGNNNILLYDGKTNQYGGAVNLDYGSLTVTNCQFGDNFTRIEQLVGEFKYRTYGGTINVGQGSTLIRSTFFVSDPHSTVLSGGHADFGGHISVQTVESKDVDANLSFRTVIENSTIKFGLAEYSGGGVYVGTQPALTGKNAKSHYFSVADTIFDGNAANHRFAPDQFGTGGGISIVGHMPTALVSRSSFQLCEASVRGGGISVEGSSLLVSDTTFTENDAIYSSPFTKGDGAGIAATSALGATAETLTLFRNTFSKNGAKRDGGAIWSDRVSLAIANSTFDENFTQTTGDGGAILFRQSAKVTKDDVTTFIGNASFSVINSTFSANAAAGLGGAVVFRDLRSAANFEFVTMTLNTANEAGGGIALESVVGDSGNTPMVNIDASVISGNTVGTGSDDVHNVTDTSAFDFDYSLLGVFTASGTGTDIGYDSTNKMMGIDPLLGSLEDNGGPTKTHMPDLDSPLIDAILDTAYTVTGDQRGFARGVATLNPLNPYDDIGSVELSPVSKLIVNDGEAQRSRLYRIEIEFLVDANISELEAANAITLTRTMATSTGTVGTVVKTGPMTGNYGRITVTPVSGNPKAVVLTFDNEDDSNVSPGVEYGSLADGRWQLVINTTTHQFTTLANGSDLRRLFGDSQNDGTVDGTDLIAIGNAFNMSSLAFDFNQDTVVDGTDLTYFGNRWGIVL